MIDLIDVSKSYGPGLPAVNHANLHVDKGEFVFQFQPLPGDSTGSFLRPDTRGNPRTEVFGFQLPGTDRHNPEDLYLE